MVSIPRPLVSTVWLKKALAAGSPSFRLLDVTWTPTGKSGQEIHAEKHIPGSHFFDMEECRNKESPYRVMLPSPRVFSEYVGSLGIGNDTHVITYDNDPVFQVKNMGRVWWMFRVFGHDRVSALDGGLAQWIKEGNPVTSQLSEAPQPAKFEAKFRPELVKSYEDIMDHLKEPKFQLLDSRPPQWYDGSKPSQLKGLRLGTIKTSVHLPFPQLFQEGTTVFRPPQEIREIFRSKGINLSKPLTTTCNVGVTANMLTLGAFIAGKEDVAVYDGSWNEFSQRAPDDAINIATLREE
ncbi:thiosulfate sulfurtransferase-like [Diadema setosum]|uniref:thiosulfate sulfurtransferase-like n=1 Tax=Diadema setosum TaxID=31175 RepID=UPI003B3B5FA1